MNEELYQQWKAEKLKNEEEYQAWRQIKQNNPEGPSIMERVGRGMMDFGQGVKQVYLSTFGEPGEADAYTEQVNDELAMYEKGRGPDAGIDWARMGGNIATAAPAMLVPGGQTLGARVALGTALGGAENAMQFTPEGAASKEKAMQAGIGAVAGGALPIAGRALSDIGNATTPKMIKFGSDFSTYLQQKFQGVPNGEQIAGAVETAFKDRGLKGLTEETAARIERDVASSLRPGRDPAEAARAAVMRSLGFEGDLAPTAAQLKRHGRVWRDEQALSKLDGGEALNQRYIDQNARFGDLADDMTQDIGGKSLDDVAATREAFSTFNRMWEKSQGEVSAAYKAARAKAPDTTATLTNFNNKIDEFTQSGEDEVIKHIGAARQMLRRQALDEEGELIPLDMENIENMRKTLVRRTSNATDPADKWALREMIDALDEDISGAGDVFAEARAEAASRFEKFRGDSVAKILKGKMRESNFVKTRLLGGETDDIKHVRDLLGPDSQEWSNLRGRAFDWLMDRSYGGDAGSEAAAFSGKMLSKTLKKVGDSKLKAIFQPQEVDRLKQLAKAGQWIRSAPPMSDVNWSNSSSDLIRTIQRASGQDGGGIVREALSAIPGAAASNRNAAAVQSALQGNPLVPNPLEGAMRSLYKTAPAGATQLLPEQQP